MRQIVTKVEHLTVELADGAAIVEDVSFDIARGEILGLVGESGSGKTTVATALLGHYRAGARFRSGSISIGHHQLEHLDPKQLRDIRAKVVSYVPQDPSGSLNPAKRINEQMRELLGVHSDLPRQAAQDAIFAALKDVNLPATEEFVGKYPHQISGGQAQRVCLAMAFLLRPQMVILDEPTTGLDVTSQAHVLRTIRRLCQETGAGALYVTHDLAVVSELADRVMVMYSGSVVELGTLEEVLVNPRHPYTSRLLAASPDLKYPKLLQSISGTAPSPHERPEGCRFNTRCTMATDLCHVDKPQAIALSPSHEVACFHWDQVVRGDEEPVQRDRATQKQPVLTVRDLQIDYGSKRIVDQVTFELKPGECLALVGESGSGKTTIARTIIGLKDASNGSIQLRGEELAPTPRKRQPQQVRDIQFIFQNPLASMNPKSRILDILGKPIRHFHGVRGGEEVRSRAAAALERVALPLRVLDRYPRELSGGERQRVAIARALVCEPSVLICDEITSALDVSVQAAVVELLDRLRRESELSLLFVTHNLGLVRSIADSVAVFRYGRIVETGSCEEVLSRPQHPYTRELLHDTPSFTQQHQPAPEEQALVSE